MNILLTVISIIVVTLILAPLFLCVLVPLLSIAAILFNGVEGAYKIDKVKSRLNIKSDAKAIAFITKRIAIMAIVATALSFTYYIPFNEREFYVLLTGVLEIIATIIHLIIFVKTNITSE